ncbi:MAG: hypothetical protein HON55_04695 [Legionellales bacterium]|nr:hypothetical protein [Legionellales bacterium]
MPILEMFKTWFSGTSSDPKTVTSARSIAIISRKESNAVDYITNFLDPADLVALTSVNKSWVKAESSSTKRRDVFILMGAVMDGNKDKAKELVKNNPTLLLNKTTATDPSGREFESKTAYQYALWALDSEMVVMLSEYIDPQEALRQLDALESLESIRQSMNNVLVNIGNLNQEQQLRNLQSERRCLPMHVVQRYFVETPSYERDDVFYNNNELSTIRGDYANNYRINKYKGSFASRSFAAMRPCETWRNYEEQPAMEFIKNHWFEGEKICVRALHVDGDMYKGIAKQLDGFPNFKYTNTRFRQNGRMGERTGCEISPVKSKGGRALGRILQPLVVNKNYNCLENCDELVKQMVHDRGQFDRILEQESLKISTHMDNLRQAPTATLAI